MRISIALLAIALLAVLALVARGAAQEPARLASDEAVRALLARRVDVQKRSVGIVVGMVEPGGRRVVAYGRAAKGDGPPLDGNTVFEIGSVTKVFTSLLLAEMARRGEVGLEDPAARYLPAGTPLPERGRAITLLDLATHTSGLPRLPSNMEPGDPANPYADYSEERLHGFLSGYRLTRDVGASFEYSNLGAGLLGHLLARRAGSDYETAVRARVLEPLGMRSTAITLTPEMRARAATDHDAGLDPVPYWDLTSLAGAGALRSTVNDMLALVEAALGRGDSPLAPALGDMLATRRSAGAAQMEAGLGWQILKQGGQEIVWHNGGTAGFRSFVGLDRARGVGLVILSNSGAAEGVDDIALHLLRGGGPLYDAKVRTAVPLEASVFDRYVGRYQLAPTFVMTISREGDRFFVQATGQPKLEMKAEGPRDFFLTAVDAQLTFEVDASGRATALVLHQNGADQRARRVD